MTEKQIAGEKAVDFVQDGMIVGLGTGSTVTFTIQKIGELVQKGMKIRGVSTSSVTSAQAKSLGIPLLPLDEVEYIDLTIDGADEVDANFNGIKGGGGAMLFEKIVARASKKNIWVVNSRKMVSTLGKFPVPVEVIPFGYRHVIRRMEKLGLNPVIRNNGDAFYRTDSNNYVIDLHMNAIKNVVELDLMLKSIAGVVEHGLFIGIADTVVVAGASGLEVIGRK